MAPLYSELPSPNLKTQVILSEAIVWNHRGFRQKSNNLLHGHCHPHTVQFIIDSIILRAT